MLLPSTLLEPLQCAFHRHPLRQPPRSRLSFPHAPLPHPHPTQEPQHPVLGDGNLLKSARDLVPGDTESSVQMQQLFDRIGAEDGLGGLLGFQVPIEEGRQDAAERVVTATGVDEDGTGEGFEEISESFGSGHA